MVFSMGSSIPIPGKHRKMVPQGVGTWRLQIVLNIIFTAHLLPQETDGVAAYMREFLWMEEILKNQLRLVGEIPLFTRF